VLQSNNCNSRYGREAGTRNSSSTGASVPSTLFISAAFVLILNLIARPLFKWVHLQHIIHIRLLGIPIRMPSDRSHHQSAGSRCKAGATRASFHRARAAAAALAVAATTVLVQAVGFLKTTKGWRGTCFGACREHRTKTVGCFASPWQYQSEYHYQYQTTSTC
jgi:hypothetical protein